MVPAVRFLYLAFCVQGASTNGVDSKVFYWTRNETSWNLCGRSWHSNLKTSHYLQIIPIHWPLEKLSETFTPGEPGSTWSKTILANVGRQKKTDETSIPPKKRNLDAWANLCGAMLFHDPDTTLPNTSVTEVPLTAGVWKQWLCQSCLHWCWALVFGGRRLAQDKQLNQTNGGSCVIFESFAGWSPYVLIPGARRAPRLDGTSCQLPCEL